MSYNSPIRVLASFADSPDALDPKNLVKIQKRVLLELELSGKPYLVLEEAVELTKNDIISLFDELKEGENLFYHQLIFKNKHLLNLLEKGLYSNEPLFDPDIIFRKEYSNFKAFVSPYLVEPLGRELNKAFNDRNFVKGRKLLQEIRLVDEVNSHRVFSRFKSSFLQLISEIDQVVKNANPHQDIDRFRFIPNNDLILFLNELPPEYEKLRNGFAESLISLTFMLQKGQARFVYLIYLSLKALNCRQDIKELIEKNAITTASWGNIANSYPGWDEIIEESQRKKNNSDGASTFPFMAAAFFVILFIVVIAVSKKPDKSPIGRFGIDYHGITIKNSEDSHFKRHLREISITGIRGGYSQDSTADTFMVDLSESRIYPQKFGALQNYKKGEIPLMLNNNSAYDAVVFLKTDRYNYSAFLGKGKELRFKGNVGDVLSFYLGNSWDPEGHSSLPDYRLKEVKHDMKGFFQMADSTTLEYLDRYFAIYCSNTNCESLELSLTSDENGKFLFDKNNNIIETGAFWTIKDPKKL